MSGLPVALLTGALGSGKTTLLNALLHDPRLADTAVAINEFGEAPLDQDLIAHDDDKTVVMANGCLCCNLAGDFEEAVMRIFSRRQLANSPQFSRLIVEPSGLADPAPIAQAILRNPVLSRFLRLEYDRRDGRRGFRSRHWLRGPKAASRSRWRIGLS